MVEGEYKNIEIQRVMYVPESNARLLSVSRLAEQGYTVNFTPKACQILNRQNQVIAQGNMRNNLYYI
ncbi:hypothetical protein M407DRAFT_78680, partial [Tulasnella calospora MUT 4182]